MKKMRFTILKRIWRASFGKFVCVTLFLWIAIAAISLFWTPYSLLKTNGYEVWQKPSFAHLLGTDGTGADMLSWLMAGSRVELVIVICTVMISALIGTVLLSIMISQYKIIRATSVMAVDALISVPTVLIALMLAVPFGTNVLVIVIACGFGYGFNLARIVRPSANLVLQSDYVNSAISQGASRRYVLLRHVLPNITPVALVQLSLSAGTVILAESGLTYLGVGVQSGVPSWGRVLATSVTLIHVNPLAVLWPGLIVTIVVVALNLLGDVLRKVLDPCAKSMNKVGAK
ncbi:ABC-type dipeptide/oligopeptide/nickel transport systems permease component [Gardnerella greenwoodii 00703Dmash]|uniref:ABC-type dipeptide/oligopeptide/nickel transport systems permease component n=2 Tax=Gardnerella greenwoodii TaxID=2914925 RepID=I4M8D5_9BIFI|nr:ABC-type dipeptide/oligopeptide/nickel transport systems permease component [Gardnerella greenwoodii 00703Dmash]